MVPGLHGDFSDGHRELSKRHRILIALLGGIVLSLVFYFTGTVQSLEHVLYDIVARSDAQAESARRKSENDNPIELIYVDQYSLTWVERNLGISWPWPRELYGVIAEFCSLAKVQAFDILFSETSPFGPEDDARCGAAMDRAGNVVIAEAFDPLTKARLSPLAAKNIDYGSVKGVIDSDGVLRKYGIWDGGDAAKKPSLGLAALIKAGEPISTLPENSQAYLRFRGHSPSFPARNAAEILASAIQRDGGRESQVKPEDFSGKYVFIGFSAPGLLDRQAVPTDSAMPGTEIHATFVNNFLNGSLLWPVSPIADIFIAALFGLGAACLAVFLKKPIALAAGAILVIFAPVISGFFLYRSGVVTTVSLQLLMGLSAYGTGIMLSYTEEGRKRAFLRRTFAQYLAPPVVDAIIRNPGLLRLGGEERTITVFFSDIQGFTTLSESLGPHQIAAFMNTYLSLVSSIILDEGGTLDKYVGDAVVAFWNAPLDQEDHAARAVRAALRCQKALMEAGEAFLAIGTSVPMTRIGIHTGRAIVGNMGSPARFNYTAMGDVVNTASRLEGANKTIGTCILVSAEAVAACLGPTATSLAADGLSDRDVAVLGFKFRRLGEIMVPGKKAGIEVWEPCLADGTYSFVLPWTGQKTIESK